MNSQESEKKIINPRWPNPAPRGPFHITARIPMPDGKGVASTHFAAAPIDSGIEIAFIVPDGEELTDILNRAYWVGRIDGLKQAEQLAIELAKEAIEELAQQARGMLLECSECVERGPRDPHDPRAHTNSRCRNLEPLRP